VTLIETARLLAFIGARDGWAPNDHHVAAWHPTGTDGTSFAEAMDRVLDHRPGHRISLCCVIGNCDPRSPHDITAEDPYDAVRFVREEIQWRQGFHDRYGVTEPLTERSYALMVKAVGPSALDAYRAAVAA
jgi:hypothetical protein